MSDDGLRDEVAGVLAGHPPTETECGPLFCRPCSEAIGDWVQWTPEHAAQALLPLLARMLAEARGEVLRAAAVSLWAMAADCDDHCDDWWRSQLQLRAALAEPTGPEGERPCNCVITWDPFEARNVWLAADAFCREPPRRVSTDHRDATDPEETA